MPEKSETSTLKRKQDQVDLTPEQQRTLQFFVEARHSPQEVVDQILQSRVEEEDDFFLGTPKPPVSYTKLQLMGPIPPLPVVSPARKRGHSGEGTSKAVMPEVPPVFDLQLTAANVDQVLHTLSTFLHQSVDQVNQYKSDALMAQDYLRKYNKNQLKIQEEGQTVSELVNQVAV